MLSYTVQPGDTMSAIAAANNESLSALEAANPAITDPDEIFAGQVIATVAGDGSVAVTSAPAPAAAPAAAPSDSSCLDNIAAHESSGNPTAVNPSSGTYGLFQFLPGTGPGYSASVADQYAAAHSYAVARYGGDCAAWSFWEANSWW